MNQMELPREELERMMFFEEARQKAEVDHKASPKDAQVRLLGLWPGRGGASEKGEGVGVIHFVSPWFFHSFVHVSSNIFR